MNVITRFAPSPTGYLHAGNYRTALFAYIFSHQNKGSFILRIEDTDKDRSKKEYEDNIIDSLNWLGLKYDKMERQSDRADIHAKYIQKLIDSGHAYISNEIERQKINDAKLGESTDGESSKNIKKASRDTVIRFKNPNKKVVFEDLIRGHIEFDTTELDDFVIARSLNEPVFHLAVVIDDAEEGITHIIRGEDHISNTPRHILLYEALGFVVPQYAHIPLLLSTDRSKLSKRKGALPITEYRQRGFMPEAVINYLSLLGWHPSDEREILSLEDIIKDFSLERVQKSGAIFDEEKLLWFNRGYIAKLTDDQFSSQAQTFIPEWLHTHSDQFKKLIPLLREKIGTFGDIQKLFDANGELAFINTIYNYDSSMLLWKKNPDPIIAKKHLEESYKTLNEKAESEFTPDIIKQALWPYAETNGKGDVLWPLRIAITGQERSPDPFTSISLIGKEKTLQRIDTAIKKLS